MNSPTANHLFDHRCKPNASSELNVMDGAEDAGASLPPGAGKLPTTRRECPRDYPHKIKCQKKTDHAKHSTVASHATAMGGVHGKREWQETTYGMSGWRGQSDESRRDRSRETAVRPEPNSDTVRHAAMPSPNTIKR